MKYWCAGVVRVARRAFLPKIYGGGLDDVEKLRHDRRYSTEVAGARGRLEGVGEGGVVGGRLGMAARTEGLRCGRVCSG